MSRGKFDSVELHHEVLVPWSSWRREFSPDTAPHVLVLDHHTDVVRAFRSRHVEVSDGAWRSPEAVAAAVGELRHDEHLDWAVRSGLIAGAVVVSHVSGTPCASCRLEVRCAPDWPDENRQLREPEYFRPMADAVLESAFLKARLGDIRRFEPFILDIDCDYFLTEAALSPRDGDFFQMLLRRAVLVSVSLEADWVRLLRLPGEKITAELVREKLRTMFNGARLA